MINIILVGMMGAGKTTIGKLLEQKLEKYSFIDIDEYIEEKNNMSISEIFKKYSEKFFREEETSAIQELSHKENLIISTGGGAFESKKNRNNLLSSGKVFYLYAPSDVLYDRIKTEGNRPLLKCDNPKKYFDELLNKREINYKKANYIIDTTSLSSEGVVDEILRRGYETIDIS